MARNGFYSDSLLQAAENLIGDLFGGQIICADFFIFYIFRKGFETDVYVTGRPGIFGFAALHKALKESLLFRIKYEMAQTDTVSCQMSNDFAVIFGRVDCHRYDDSSIRL